MGDNKFFKDVIEEKFHQLTRKQRKLADFILNNPSFVGMNSAAKVGKACGVSETTVIRVCYILGYGGFSELQKDITRHLFNQNSTSTLGTYLSNKREIQKNDDLVASAMAKDISKIDQLSKQVSDESFQSVVKSLHEARKIYILGQGASEFPAKWLHFTLNVLRPGVSFIETHTPSLIRFLKEIEQDAVVIILSLHRYMKEPVQIAETLHQRDINIIAITDSKLAPICRHSSTAFVFDEIEKSTIDLIPALTSFLNALAAGMVTIDSDHYDRGRLNYDDYIHSFIGEKFS